MAPQLQQVQPTRRPAAPNHVGATGELSNLVLDVEVQVEVGLGNAALTVEEFLEMGRGSVVELDLGTERSVLVWEVLVSADSGGRYELYIDATTGEVVKQERDD